MILKFQQVCWNYGISLDSVTSCSLIDGSTARKHFHKDLSVTEGMCPWLGDPMMSNPEQPSVVNLVAFPSPPTGKASERSVAAGRPSGFGWGLTGGIWYEARFRKPVGDKKSIVFWLKVRSKLAVKYPLSYLGPPFQRAVGFTKHQSSYDTFRFDFM